MIEHKLNEPHFLQNTAVLKKSLLITIFSFLTLGELWTAPESHNDPAMILARLVLETLTCNHSTLGPM